MEANAKPLDDEGRLVLIFAISRIAARERLNEDVRAFLQTVVIQSRWETYWAEEALKENSTFGQP